MAKRRASAPVTDGVKTSKKTQEALEAAATKTFTKVNFIGLEKFSIPQDVLAEIERVAISKGLNEVTISAASSNAVVVWIGGVPMKFHFKGA